MCVMCDRKIWIPLGVMLMVAACHVSPQALAFDGDDAKDPAFSGALPSREGVAAQKSPQPPILDKGADEDLVAGLRSRLTGRTGGADLTTRVRARDYVRGRNLIRTQNRISRDMRSINDSVRRMNSSINAIKRYNRLFRTR